MKLKRIYDSEAGIKNKFNRWLADNIRRGRFIKCKLVSYAPLGIGEAGTPDKVGCVNSFFVGVEFKSRKGKLSPLQEVRHKEWRAAGGYIIVGNDIEELRRQFKELYDHLIKIKI